jgi:hypothetical protein
MSFDIYIGEHSFNQTFNLAKLFFDHLPHVEERAGEEVGRGLRQLHGKTGAEALPIIQHFFEKVYDRMYDGHKEGERGVPAFTNKYDAMNGWGCTLGGIVFMGRLMAACVENMDATIEIR